MNKKLSVFLVFFLVLIGGGCGYYFAIVKPHNEAVNNFDKVIKTVNDKNNDLDETIDQIQAAIDSENKPLDPMTKTALEEALNRAKNARVEVPEIPQKTDEINKLNKKLSSPIDYTENIQALELSLENFENSIKQNQQVTNPGVDFVTERLKTISTITGIQAATENNDPNGNLNKDGGYTQAIYFTDSQVNEVLEGNDIVQKGTEAGGQIEVYKNGEDAQERNDYLTVFDGAGLFNSGSHEVCGSCVIRTSSSLTATQQKELTKKIKEAFIKL